MTWLDSHLCRACWSWKEAWQESRCQRCSAWCGSADSWWPLTSPPVKNMKAQGTFMVIFNFHNTAYSEWNPFRAKFNLLNLLFELLTSGGNKYFKNQWSMLYNNDNILRKKVCTEAIKTKKKKTALVTRSCSYRRSQEPWSCWCCAVSLCCCFQWGRWVPCWPAAVLLVLTADLGRS